MAETPDTVFNRGCCPNATPFRYPSGSIHFEFRSTMGQVRLGSDVCRHFDPRRSQLNYVPRA
jgi:hypothetical protein